MENEEVIFLSKGKNGDALVYSTDGKSTECLSTLPIAIPMDDEEINIEEELKFMNIYKSDDPRNYNRGTSGNALLQPVSSVFEKWPKVNQRNLIEELYKTFISKEFYKEDSDGK